VVHRRTRAPPHCRSPAAVALRRLPPYGRSALPALPDDHGPTRSDQAGPVPGAAAACRRGRRLRRACPQRTAGVQGAREAGARRAPRRRTGRCRPRDPAPASPRPAGVARPRPLGRRRRPRSRWPARPAPLRVGDPTAALRRRADEHDVAPAAGSARSGCDGSECGGACPGLRREVPVGRPAVRTGRPRSIAVRHPGGRPRDDRQHARVRRDDAADRRRPCDRRRGPGGHSPLGLWAAEGIRRVIVKALRRDTDTQIPAFGEPGTGLAM
jgi:hypothetical protein